MFRTASDPVSGFAALALLGVAAPAIAQAPDADPPRRIIVATETSLSEGAAELTLELSDGSVVSYALDDGAVWVDGRRVSDFERGGDLERSWRALLQDLRGSPESVGQRLRDWEPAGEGGDVLDQALEDLLTGEADVSVRRTLTPAPAPAIPQGDSMDRLQSRIRELERTIDELEDRRAHIEVVSSRGRGGSRMFHNLWEGISGVFSTLMVYGILFALGAAVVFFGGRKYLEGVADTARHATLRSGLVGFAASFLVVPAFIVGALVLAVSIVGIPALLVWLPLFPVAVVLGAVYGYLSVAHAAGEALAERRFYGSEWFKRANSYYYLMTGLGVLLVLFIAASVFHMAGFLGFLEGLLVFLGVALTWGVFTIGFGAVLISRGGTRPLKASTEGAPSFEEESAHV